MHQQHEQQQHAPKKRKIEAAIAAPSIKVVDEIDLVLLMFQENIACGDMSFVEWLTNEVTSYLLPMESDSPTDALSVDTTGGDLMDTTSSINMYILLMDTAKRYTSNEFVQRDVILTLATWAYSKGAEFCLAVANNSATTGGGGGMELVVQAMTRFPENVPLQ